jgi:Fe-S cluster assembly protein SufD
MAEPSASPSAPPGAAWSALRAAAAARAAVLGPPTNALEDWRYVNLAPLGKPLPAATGLDPAAIAPHRLAGAAACLVLVDGAFRPELSDLARLPRGLTVDDLAAVPTAQRDALAARWTAGLAATTDLTACWTLADLAGGLRLRAGGPVDGGVQILALSTGGRHGSRVVIEVAPGGALDLVIGHVALAAARSSVGIEAAVAAGGSLRVDELQHGDAGAQVFPLAWLDLERDANVAWSFAGSGGGLVRQRIQATLRQPGAHASLDGVAVLDGGRQLHHLSRVLHAVGGTTSTQLVKTIAAGAAQASFDGLVDIAAGADGAAAEQHHHNLLLSPKARVDTRPQLDIRADDVKAAHGATVGRPNPDELFYLRSRGLTGAQALAVLTRGFALEVVARMHNPAARALAERAIVGSIA